MTRDDTNRIATRFPSALVVVAVAIMSVIAVGAAARAHRESNPSRDFDRFDVRNIPTLVHWNAVRRRAFEADVDRWSCARPGVRCFVEVAAPSPYQDLFASLGALSGPSLGLARCPEGERAVCEERAWSGLLGEPALVIRSSFLTFARHQPRTLFPEFFVWMDRRVVRRVVEGAGGRRSFGGAVVRLERCLRHTLAHYPSISGRVDVSLSVGANGFVSGGYPPETSIDHPRVRGCLALYEHELRSPPRGGTPSVALRYELGRVFEPLEEFSE